MTTILVTGGCGFIGRAVTSEFLDHGYSVRVLDALIDQVHGDDGPAMPEAVDIIEGDIRDAGAVGEALDGVDGVIHLAAEVGVGQSMYEIARYVGTNDLGTAILLEAMIDRPVNRIVVASSMSVYGEGRYCLPDGTPGYRPHRDLTRMPDGVWDPVTDNGAPLTPVATDEHKEVDLASVYALTKYMQEQAVLIFGRTYNRKAAALRLFNVFGPGQALSNPYTGVLANFASRIAAGERPMVFEDGNQRRDFVHVRDVARAFRLAFEKPDAAGHVFNIGSGNSYSIKQVAHMLARAMGEPDREPEILEKARSGDIRHCFADISKARELLGFEPAYELQESLPELVDWVRSTHSVDRGPEMRQHLEQKGLVT